MAFFTTRDGLELFYGETGEGYPVIFVHEFAGDARSYEQQVRFFSRGYRCIVYNARGYPPSAVPEDPAAYSQNHARDDLFDLLDFLGIDRAHIVGLSMGAFTALHAAIGRPERVSAIIVAGCGYGTEPDKRAQFQSEIDTVAQRFLDQGADEAGRRYAAGPTRLQFLRKDPRGHAEFEQQMAEHPAIGSANTLRGVQRERPALWELEAPLAAMRTPTLIMTGDEDDPCLEPALYLKKTIPSSGLVVLANTGHTINLEEPAAFNAVVIDFFHQVERGGWPVRDPRTVAGGMIDLEPEAP